MYHHHYCPWSSSLSLQPNDKIDLSFDLWVPARTDGALKSALFLRRPFDNPHAHLKHQKLLKSSAWLVVYSFAQDIFRPIKWVKTKWKRLNKTATRKGDKSAVTCCSGLVGALSGPLCRFVWSNGVQAGLWSIAECSGSAHGVCVCVCVCVCTLVSAAATADVFLCWNRAEVCRTLNKAMPCTRLPAERARVLRRANQCFKAYECLCLCHLEKYTTV